MADKKQTMIYWLARAAQELREAADPPRRQVHIAAELSIDQSTIYRFEQGDRWPSRTDAIVAAYAADLEIADVREIWQRALDLWKAEGDMPDVYELMGTAPRRRFDQALDDQAQARRQAPPGSDSASAPTPTRRRGKRAG